MFNVSAVEFAKMNATAQAVSRHFGFHWGRVDLIIDAATGHYVCICACIYMCVCQGGKTPIYITALIYMPALTRRLTPTLSLALSQAHGPPSPDPEPEPEPEPEPGRWYVNEVQDLTDDIMKTFMMPRTDSLVSVPRGCRSTYPYPYPYPYSYPYP